MTGTPTTNEVQECDAPGDRDRLGEGESGERGCGSRWGWFEESPPDKRLFLLT